MAHTGAGDVIPMDRVRGRRLVVRDPSATVRVPTMPTQADTGSTVRTEGPHTPPEPDRRRFSFLRELPVLIVLALVLALVLKTLVVQAFFIPSDSMSRPWCEGTGSS